ncbi:MAG TPA: RIP metalloprotease RseP [Niabella sp.]|nr:RIP metalloprotease RseP [Niabella sp.]HOZ95605.1 RIP metalloprotease RseP [Niabella sp.]HQW13845.1 RIP metalloprotease RseP [Niabella sp.]HQX19262.1 RIP metalloprotease RseP [Niabella sp.]HRB06184.1 RIP metalloprotease RseP [Niabella sp.]
MLYTLAINWSNVGVQVAQLLLSLSLLVLLHEFGHFITARWFGCRVEKFYLFFDPWFSLFKKKVGDTEYGVGWLPLGGYVKISGMIDESMDKEAMSQPAKSYEFRSKPAWQRLIIMLAGIIMNVLVAFLIYAMILFVWGESKTPMSSIKNGVAVTDSLMSEIGIKSGDKIIAVNGESIQYFEDLALKILIGSKQITLERNGQQMNIDVPVNLIGKLVESRRKKAYMFMERVPSYVGNYDTKYKMDTLGGYKAGLRKMDLIKAIDSVPVQFYDEMAPILRSKKNSSVALSIVRDNQPITINASVDGEGKIGIPYLTEDEYVKLGAFSVERTRYGFFEAFPAGVKKAGEKLKAYIDQFALILNPKTEAYKGVGGFKAMGSIFPTYWSWEAFWNITAFLSIILAFMNLLPIPALDGGHVMFTLYEMVSGRKPSDKFLEYAQMVGMILLLGLMLYANGNDWFGWGK